MPHIIKDRNMKGILLTVQIIILTIASIGQTNHVSIAPLSNIEYYVGLPNPVMVISDKCPCDSLIIDVPDGSATMTDTCQYNLVFHKKGISKVKIFMKSGKDKSLISNWSCNVKSVKEDVNIIDTNNSVITTETKESFKKANYIWVDVNRISLQGVTFKISKFTVIIIRNNKVYFLKEYSNCLFDQELKAQLKTLRSKDVLIFNQIYYIAPSGLTMIARPLEYHIE